MVILVHSCDAGLQKMKCCDLMMALSPHEVLESRVELLGLSWFVQSVLEADMKSSTRSVVILVWAVIV